jgi:succinate dehydrogenase / fumarate reductase iron-sulfur subunit
MAEELHFKIFRFDPQADPGPYFKHYQVKAEPEERILDCLNRIKWEQDGTLSYRMSCAHGVCGSDGMRINGTCRLACQAIVKDYRCPEVVLEPLPGFRVLKDLVVDIDPFLEGIKNLRPYLIASAPPEKERIQTREERRKAAEAIRCILCACCTASCPVNWIREKYIGPAALLWAFRYIFESRDQEALERLKQIDHPDGAWGCVNHFECTRVCPKEIPVTKSINRMKREIEKKLRNP